MANYRIPQKDGVLHAGAVRFMSTDDHLTVMVGGCGVGRLPLGASSDTVDIAVQDAVTRQLQYERDKHRAAFVDAELALAEWLANPRKWREKP